MATQLLTERYANEIAGVIESYDRIVLSGHLQPVSYAQGMTSYLYRAGIRIFDYTQFAEPLRNLIRSNAERLAEANGLAIEFISKSQGLRKEAQIEALLEKRDHLPGKSMAQISHLLKRLRVHGLLTKVQRTYRYYLSDLGRQVAALVLTLRSLVIIPALAR